MKIEKITMTKVTAEEGKTFMKGESVIGKVIYLGVNDSIDNYTQVNDEDLPKEEVEPIEEVKDEETIELVESSDTSIL